MSSSAAPPSPLEVQRKLSVHSISKGARKTQQPSGPVSGTESDSDSVFANELSTTVASYGSASQAPLFAIAERRDASGEDSEDEEEGGWKTAKMKDKTADSRDEGVIRSGYLWKKGERRKTWKKRWFVLRPHHLAYYKNSAEYQLHRLLELSDVHSCIQVTLKRHEHTFGLISPSRTFYLRASSDPEVQEWVTAIEDARRALMATSTQSSNNGLDSIPVEREMPVPMHSQPSQLAAVVVASSSDSEDAAPNIQQIVAPSPQRLTFAPTISKPPQAHQTSPSSPGKDNKVILSGYLMKCGSKRRNWRKRWFVLTSEKLVYSGSHMDTKPHRQFPFSNILDALEFDVPTRQSVGSPSSPASQSGVGDQDDSNQMYKFKIVTTKRTLLLCAPTEEDEIKWLGAVRALIARRSESGQVPGYTPKESSKLQSTEHPSTGIKSKMRRLSASGPDIHEKLS